MRSAVPYMFEFDVGAELANNPYQHVHHADIMRILEHGRAAYLESLGFPLEYFFDKELFFVLSSIQVKYLREVKVGKIQVSCHSVEIEGKVLRIAQEITNQRGKRCVIAQVDLMLLSRQKARAIEIPVELTAKMSHIV